MEEEGEKKGKCDVTFARWLLHIKGNTKKALIS